jgi:hypothetical protein
MSPSYHVRFNTAHDLKILTGQDAIKEMVKMAEHDVILHEQSIRRIEQQKRRNEQQFRNRMNQLDEQINIDFIIVSLWRMRWRSLTMS